MANSILSSKIEYVSVCLSFIRYYTIHPIATKLWEVDEYIPAKVSSKNLFFFLQIKKKIVLAPHN